MKEKRLNNIDEEYRQKKLRSGDLWEISMGKYKPL
jgi:hypothetical protein